MRRAFDAMHAFAVGDEEPLYMLTLSDPDAVDFISGLHPQYPIDWVRDPWPGEVVPPGRVLPNGKVHCCRTVGEIQHSIHVILARDAALAAVAEAASMEMPWRPLAEAVSAHAFTAKSAPTDTDAECEKAD
jgi:hypothetical protein